MQSGLTQHEKLSLQVQQRRTMPCNSPETKKNRTSKQSTNTKTTAVRCARQTCFTARHTNGDGENGSRKFRKQRTESGSYLVAEFAIETTLEELRSSRSRERSSS